MDSPESKLLSEASFLLNYGSDEAAWHAALKNLNRFLDREPGSVEALNLRGLCHIYLQKYEKALKDLNKAIELDPAYHDAHYHKGLLMLRTRRDAEAVEAFTAALQLDAMYVPSLSNRGLCLYRQGRHSEALTDFQAALALDDSDWIVHSHGGMVLLETGDDAGALNHLNISHLLNPQYGTTLFLKGKAELALQNYQSAILSFNSANGLGLSDPDLFFRRGLAKIAFPE
jgi:tetratricopeptide (TPR) repeat protein